jgi:MYXO-CTERM domain-containing protein
MSSLVSSLVWGLAVAWIAANPPSVGAEDPRPAGTAQPIYGGDPVAPGAWPAIVAVQTDKLCTGTLVAPDLVLTAAHCLSPDPTAAVRIVFGDDIFTGQIVLSEQWGRHPEFCLPSDCDEDLHDFGWVRLPTPVSVEPIVPITDQAEFDEVMRKGTPLEFVGYGTDEAGVTGTKREVTASLTGFSSSGREFDAGGEGKDTCNGDSGGPALVRLSSGEWRLAGVISRGGECGEGGIYGVPAPELCWLRDSSGVDLLPAGCDSCDCLSLRGDTSDEGCACALERDDPGERGRAAWLLAVLGLGVGLGLRRRSRTELR